MHSVLYWEIMGGLCVFIFVLWVIEKYKFIKKNHELEKELAERRKRTSAIYPRWEDKEHK